MDFVVGQYIEVMCFMQVVEQGMQGQLQQVQVVGVVVYVQIQLVVGEGGVFVDVQVVYEVFVVVDEDEGCVLLVFFVVDGQLYVQEGIVLQCVYGGLGEGQLFVMVQVCLLFFMFVYDVGIKIQVGIVDEGCVIDFIVVDLQFVFGGDVGDGFVQCQWDVEVFGKVIQCVQW